MGLANPPCEADRSLSLAANVRLSHFDGGRGLINGDDDFRRITRLRWNLADTDSVSNADSKAECSFGHGINREGAFAVGIGSIPKPLSTVVFCYEEINGTDPGRAHVIHLVLNIENSIADHQGCPGSLAVAGIDGPGRR